MCGSSDAFANGDDCIEDNSAAQSEIRARYLAHGRRVREIEEVPFPDGELDFTSHAYSVDGSFYLSNPAKTVYKLLEKEICGDSLRDVLMKLSTHPKFKYWEALITSSVSYASSVKDAKKPQSQETSEGESPTPSHDGEETLIKDAFSRTLARSGRR
jgi:hypothetical protein